MKNRFFPVYTALTLTGLIIEVATFFLKVSFNFLGWILVVGIALLILSFSLTKLFYKLPRQKYIKKLEKDTRVLKRLYFIKTPLQRNERLGAAELVGVTKATGYAWLKRWNSKGYEGLILQFISLLTLPI